MKKFLIFLILVLIPSVSFAWYKLETGSKNLVKKYNFSTKNLDKQITRKDFVETLYSWYKDYKTKRWIKINYEKYRKIDNKKYFKDVDLNSDFWKKLSYFAGLWAFSKREYFDLNWKLSQRDFFTVMRKLRIIYGLKNCKYFKICEQEANKETSFTKGTYYKYVSKILDRKLRKYSQKADYYIKNWYKPFLNPNYYFPVRRQTLNGCYAFSVRNILKYKYGIWMYIQKSEKVMKKPWKQLWNKPFINKFNKLNHIKITDFKRIDTLINSLQAWEPLAITYWLKYYSWKEKKYKKVLHIVAAYSFDEKWVWVAETVSGRRTRVPWGEIFNKYWDMWWRRMMKYDYISKKNWTKLEKIFEQKNNLLVWEF